MGRVYETPGEIGSVVPAMGEQSYRRKPPPSRCQSHENELMPSFPVEQSAIDAGKVLTWTKGFNAKGAIGNDVVKLLQDALDRKHIHVRVSALVNDVRAALHPAPACLHRIWGNQQS
jgi:hypothetical protein